jgi:glycosyltransferase involved in cell wall biosynthesis
MPAGLVDLVIPVYNEAHVLENSVARLREAMEASASFPWRIVIVDNGSTDGTAAVGQRLAASLADVHLVQLDQKGRGRALVQAWTGSDAQYSLYMDVDLSTGLSAIPEVVALLQTGADVVTGSRLHAQAKIRRSLKREVLSRVYNRLIRWTLRTRSFDDAQCGFKGVRLESVRPLLPLIQNRNWFFDTELLVLAEYAGLNVRSVPIHWIEDPDSRVNIPRTVLEDLRGLWRLRKTARRLVREWQRAREPVRETVP